MPGPILPPAVEHHVLEEVRDAGLARAARCASRCGRRCTTRSTGAEWSSCTQDAEPVAAACASRREARRRAATAAAAASSGEERQERGGTDRDLIADDGARVKLLDDRSRRWRAPRSDVRHEVERLRREIDAARSPLPRARRSARSPTPSTTRSSAGSQALEAAHPELRHARLADPAGRRAPLEQFATVRHRHPMLSLTNVTTREELARVRRPHPEVPRPRAHRLRRSSRRSTAWRSSWSTRTARSPSRSTRGDGTVGEDVTAERADDPQRAAALARRRAAAGSRRCSRCAARSTCRSPPSGRSTASARRPASRRSPTRATRPPAR